MILRVCLCSIMLIVVSQSGRSQVDPDRLGAWYMYFWNAKIKETGLGFQGDVQFRNWNLMGDLEQLLLRGGLTYTPQNTKATFTLGYAFILTGGYGIDDPSTTSESRIYQEALLPQKIGQRVYLTHRFRFYRKKMFYH